jgi:hypothetical protein
VPAGRIERHSITLIRPTYNDSFGFGIGSAESGEILVCEVSQYGLAENKLHFADMLVEVNGTSIASLHADQQHDALVGVITAGLTVTMVVERRIGLGKMIFRKESLGRTDMNSGFADFPEFAHCDDDNSVCNGGGGGGGDGGSAAVEKMGDDDVAVPASTSAPPTPVSTTAPDATTEMVLRAGHVDTTTVTLQRTSHKQSFGFSIGTANSGEQCICKVR